MKKGMLAVLIGCAMVVAACTTEDFIKLVQVAPERAAKIVVERGNLYCQLPLETRVSFREKVRREAQAQGGYFIKEEISCEGD